MRRCGSLKPRSRGVRSLMVDVGSIAER